MSDPGPAAELVHATAVAVDGRGLLITGAPGRGKTTLAFEMLALGATLISDDQVVATPAGAQTHLSAPTRLAGLIEFRGAGILRLQETTEAPLFLIADLDRAPGERMPSLTTRDLCAAPQPVILCRDRSGLAAILTMVLRAGTLPDPDLFAVP